MEIKSLQNSKVKYWVSLNNKKNRDRDRVFIVEGDHLLKEAKNKNLLLETISTIDPFKDYFVTKEIMAKISNQKSISPEIGICKYLPEQEIKGNVLILDRLQDPGNLGTIIRSAVAFNFETIILSDDSVDLYNDKVIRASEGMLFHINIKRANIEAIIPLLKEKGYKVIGSVVSQNKNILPKENVALVIGNEGKGISPKIKEFCDSFVHIPMEPNCESLNAGVAASILMYEVYK